MLTQINLLILLKYFLPEPTGRRSLSGGENSESAA